MARSGPPTPAPRRPRRPAPPRTPRPHVALELSDLAGVDEAWRTAVAERLRDGLGALNIDYRSSLGEFPGAMLPIVATHAVGQGPFAGDATRIKQRRIAPAAPSSP